MRKLVTTKRQREIILYDLATALSGLESLPVPDFEETRKAAGRILNVRRAARVIARLRSAR